MTAITTAVRLPRANIRQYLAAGTFVLLGLIEIALFGLTAHSGDAIFALSLSGSGIQVPSIHVPAAPACFVLGAISIGAGVLRATTELSRLGRRLVIAAALLSFLLALLCWADAANSVGPVNVVNLLQGTVTAAIPLVLGALSGVMCERSGVINIAIEGQLITGAFAAAAVASVVGVLWFVGMTTYLYDRVMAPYTDTWNKGNFFTNLKIPVLGDIPIIGPIFFDSNVFLYLTYLLIIVVQIGLFRTRWGLRVRAVGEHPTAADTVGIKVLWNRYRNVILGGMVAGIGGAYLTVGNVGQFSTGMSSGFGYIGLAAMIFGRWKPLGAVAAALLFGFSRQLGDVLGLLQVPVPSGILSMAPYLATIIAVAGLVGKVRAPAADGKPYVKA